jgi:phage shock protein PspC (stress-responsive transcriptional regulator)
LMRLLWIAMTILSGGLGLIIYIAAWIIMPKDYPVAAAPRSQQAPVQAT